MQSNLFANSLQTTLLIPAIVCFSVVFAGCLVYILKNNKKTTLNAFIDVVTETLVKGDKVQLVGFGSFEVRKRAARKGRNPQTKEEIKIPASKAPVFKAGKALKDLVNKK